MNWSWKDIMIFGFLGYRTSSQKRTLAPAGLVFRAWWFKGNLASRSNFKGLTLFAWRWSI